MAFRAESVFEADDSPLSVAILLLAETSMMVVAATIDPMRAANRFAGRNLFSWTVATPDGEAAVLTSGLLFPAQVAFRDMPKADVLIVLAGFNHLVHADANLIRYLRQIAPRFRAIGSVDSGGWVLARAGLLDGCRATVHPEDHEDFAAAFPAIDVTSETLVILPGRFTAAGALPAMRLMEGLISRRYGSVLAGQVSAAFVKADDVSGAAPPVAGLPGELQAAMALINSGIEEPEGMERIAARTGISRRSLEMLFRRHLSTTPARYAMDMRLQAAARMVRDTSYSLSDIAVRTGFGSQSVFSRTFRKALGTSPRAYRRALGTLIGAAPKAK